MRFTRLAPAAFVIFGLGLAEADAQAPSVPTNPGVSAPGRVVHTAAKKHRGRKHHGKKHHKKRVVSHGAPARPVA